MPNVPTYRKVKKIRHEWHIATPCDAKNFGFGIQQVEREMEAKGLQLTTDDAFFVTVTDDAIVIYVDEERADD